MIHGMAMNVFNAMEQDTSNARCVLEQGMKCVFIVEEPVDAFATIAMVTVLSSVKNVMEKV